MRSCNVVFPTKEVLNKHQDVLSRACSNRLPLLTVLSYLLQQLADARYAPPSLSEFTGHQRAFLGNLLGWDSLCLQAPMSASLMDALYDIQQVLFIHRQHVLSTPEELQYVNLITHIGWRDGDLITNVSFTDPAQFSFNGPYTAG